MFLLRSLPLPVLPSVSVSVVRSAAVLAQALHSVSELSASDLALPELSVSGLALPGLSVAFIVAALVRISVGSSTVAMTIDRKSTRLNSSHIEESRMPSSA